MFYSSCSFWVLTFFPVFQTLCSALYTHFLIELLQPPYEFVLLTLPIFAWGDNWTKGPQTVRAMGRRKVGCVLVGVRKTHSSPSYLFTVCLFFKKLFYCCSITVFCISPHHSLCFSFFFLLDTKFLEGRDWILFGFESLACGKPNIINEFQPGKHVGPEPCTRKDQFWLREQCELEPGIGIRCGSWGWGGGRSKGLLGVGQGMPVGAGR